MMLIILIFVIEIIMSMESVKSTVIREVTILDSFTNDI